MCAKEDIRNDYENGYRVDYLAKKYGFSTNTINRILKETRGTVKCVDDMGTIHVRWDCGSSLGVVYGEDACRKIKED